MYPDAGGPRPALDEMAQKLADYGYAVLVPDIYYRSGDWAPFDLNTALSHPDERKRLVSMMGGITPDRMAADGRAFFDYREARPEVSGTAFGTTGYCMGGRTSLVVAGRDPREGVDRRGRRAHHRDLSRGPRFRGHRPRGRVSRRRGAAALERDGELLRRSPALTRFALP